MHLETNQKPTPLFTRVFLDHPATVGEGYWEHFRFALRFSAVLFAAGGAALIHALVPALCKTTASRCISKLHADITARASTHSE